MKYIDVKSTDPAYNLALEEYFYKKKNETFVLLWQNNPCVVIGCNQYADREVDLETAKRMLIPVVRRHTGGGAVYQDQGNLNFSFICNVDEIPEGEVYLLEIVIQALKNLGIEACFNGRNDLLVEERKISGSAWRQDDARMLHHGTLMFDVDIAKMQRILTPDKAKLLRNGVKSVESRVANLKEFDPNLTMKKIKSQIIELTQAKEHQMTEIDKKYIQVIYENKYKTDNWNFKL